MLLGTSAFAQMSVNAGYINSTRTAKDGKSANANGAYAGVSFNIPVAGGLAVAPGLYYSMITSTDVANVGKLYSGKGTFMEHAINVPVYLNYGFALARDTKFFVFGGPYRPRMAWRPPSVGNDMRSDHHQWHEEPV
jgi:hypothetical protein